MRGRARASDGESSASGRPSESGAAASTRALRPRRRIALFAGLLVVVLLVVAEVAARIVLLVSPHVFGGQAATAVERHARLASSIETMLEDRPDSLCTMDPELGWRPRPGLDNGVDKINSQGLRSAREYAPDAGAGTLRVAAFGDSFVYGSEVETRDAWASVIERRRPDTEVLNYGVPGYGQGQVLLRLRAEVERLSPDVVLFGVATPTLLRMLSFVGGFRAPHQGTEFLSKPRFTLSADGGLELHPNPVRSPAAARRILERPVDVLAFGREDHHYQPFAYESWLFQRSAFCRLLFAAWTQVYGRYVDDERPLVGGAGAGVFNAASDNFRVLTRMLSEFDAETRAGGMRPIILILPDGYSTQRFRRGEAGILDPVREFCRERGLETIDLKDAFLAQPSAADELGWFVNRFHYSAAGNRIAADWVSAHLDALGR